MFWISKQVLHLIMDDAVDDWLLRQIQWLRRDDVIAQGIRLVQDVSICLGQKYLNILLLGSFFQFHFALKYGPLKMLHYYMFWFPPNFRHLNFLELLFTFQSDLPALNCVF